MGIMYECKIAYICNKVAADVRAVKKKKLVCKGSSTCIVSCVGWVVHAGNA